MLHVLHFFFIFYTAISYLLSNQNILMSVHSSVMWLHVLIYKFLTRKFSDVSVIDGKLSTVLWKLYLPVNTIISTEQFWWAWMHQITVGRKLGLWTTAFMWCNWVHPGKSGILDTNNLNGMTVHVPKHMIIHHHNINIHKVVDSECYWFLLQKTMK